MNPKIAKIRNKQYAKPLNFKQRQGQSEGIVQTCGYCGLSGVHRKGEGCPAYRKRCFICHMKDHFAVVCKRRRYYYSALRYRPCFTMHKSKQKDGKVKKSTELEPATTDPVFLQVSRTSQNNRSEENQRERGHFSEHTIIRSYMYI